MDQSPLRMTALTLKPHKKLNKTPTRGNQSSRNDKPIGDDELVIMLRKVVEETLISVLGLMQSLDDP